MALKSSQIKTLAIVVLALVAAVEAYFLAAPHPPSREERKAEEAAPGQRSMSIVQAGLMADAGDKIVLMFDQPAGEDEVGRQLDPAPAALSPEAKGTWRFATPYALIFTPSEPLAPDTRYTVEVDPDAVLPPDTIFTGDRQVRVRTGRFNVIRAKLTERPVPNAPGKAVVMGELTFSRPVAPEELARHLSFGVKGAANSTSAPELLTTWPSKTFSFKSGPIEKTPTAQTIVLTVSGDLAPEKSNLTLGQDFTRDITLVLDTTLRVRGMTARSLEDRGQLEIELSTPVAPAKAKEYVGVKPKADYVLSADGTRLLLTGDFEPGKAYSLTLDKGLAAEDGAVLPKAVTRKATLPDRQPSVDFAGPGMFLSAEGAKALALKSVNLSKASLRIDKVYPSNIFLLFANYEYYLNADWAVDEVPHLLGSEVAGTTLKLKNTPNQWTETPLALGKYFDTGTPGFYKVAATIPGAHSGSIRWVLITDMGLAAKMGVEDLALWVCSFATGKPVPKAKLTLLSDQNQPMGEAVTDENGLARIPLPQGQDPAKPFMVLARKGKDMSFLVFNRFKDDISGLDVSGQTLSTKGYQAFVYGERDIYRPGETLEAVAVVRDQKILPPPPMPIRIRHLDPKGRLLAVKALRTDKQGLAALSMALPEFAPTGGHLLEVEAGGEAIGQYRFQVEEFVPDRIAVKIDPEGTEAEPGTRAGFTVSGRYLFGPPASGLAAEASVTLAPVEFAPTAYPGYVFSDPFSTFAQRQIMDQSRALDAKGLAAFSFDLPKGLEAPSGLDALISARVSEPGGRGVSARVRLPVALRPAMPGLKAPAAQGVKPGEPVAFDYVVVDSAGKLAKPKALTAELYKERWQTVLRTTPEGGFRYESVADHALVESVRLDPSAKGSFSFTPRDFGSYRVVLSLPGENARTGVRFFAGGWGYSPWAMENPGRIELACDRKEYMPGETASIQVRAPFPGTLLVAVEGREVGRAQVVELTGNTAEVRIKVKRGDAPNAYVTAMLMRPAEDVKPGMPSRALGAVPLYVNRQANRLHVAVDAPRTVRPGAVLTASAATSPGAKVTLAVVDEGILQLIAQKTPDPFAAFYAKRALMVSWYDIFSMLFPEIPVHGRARAGGGRELDMESRFMRTEPLTRTKPVAFFSGILTAGTDGRVRADFPLPDFTGALRVMAVAVEEEKFGSAQDVVRVFGPLTMQPTLPRFAAPNESFQVPVTLFNNTPAGREFALLLEASGQAAVPQGRATAHIPPEGRHTFRFQAQTAHAPGAAAFAFNASGGSENASMAQNLDIRAAMPRLRRVLAGSLEKNELELPFEPDGGFVPGTERRDLAVGPGPMFALAGPLRELLAYPYGCAEQTVSKAFPLLYAADLARSLDPEGLKDSDPAALVQTAVARLRTLQTPEGGFAMWPGSGQSQPWVSIYATHFLIEAGKAGYLVPDFILEPALGHVWELTRSGSPETEALAKRQAYALFVLALGGRPDPGAATALARNPVAKRSPGAMLLAASARVLGGETGAAKDLDVDVNALAKAKRTLDANLDSPVRDLALALDALLEAAPDSRETPRLADKLARLMQSKPRGNTQETGMALMALGKYYALKGGGTQASGSVFLGGKRAGTFGPGRPLSLSMVNGTEPLSIRTDPGTKPGAVFYSQTTSGVVQAADYRPESKGLAVDLSFLDAKGEPLNLDELRQGDLLVAKAEVSTRVGPLENVAVILKLPTGLEVENPRLASRQSLPWIEAEPPAPAHLDLRDDRVLAFTDLDPDNPYVQYVQLRAVTVGNFTLPPLSAEAMYDPAIRASGKAGRLVVREAAAP